MKSEGDAESAGKRILRVVVVVSGEDKDGIPVTDAEENTEGEGEPAFEVWAEAHISDDNIIDTLGETVARDIGSEDLLDVAKKMLEALAQNLEELDEFSTEDINAALAAAEWEADSSLGRLPPLGEKPTRTG